MLEKKSKQLTMQNKSRSECHKIRVIVIWSSARTWLLQAKRGAVDGHLNKSLLLMQKSVPHCRCHCLQTHVSCKLMCKMKSVQIISLFESVDCPRVHLIMLLILLTILGALLAFHYLKLLLAGSYATKIASFRPVYPVLGHIPLFCGKNSHEAFATATRLFASVDRMGKIMLGPKPLIVVHHPEVLQQVLSRHDLYDKPFFYDFLRLGSGLITQRCKYRVTGCKYVIASHCHYKHEFGFRMK